MEHSQRTKRRKIAAKVAEHMGLPKWALYGARQGPIINPSGLTHVGPPWKLRTKLAGSQLGSPGGPQKSAQVQPLWAPHGCVGWDGTGKPRT